ncbi:MAG: hypothetical protein J7647_09790 [Cyanobacteria bacterium SBLK]|nr:hypothetical protein [Cyanobacteria bacterium SBLK]
MSTIYPFFLGSDLGLFVLTILGLLTGIRLLSVHPTTYAIAKSLAFVDLALTTLVLFVTNNWFIHCAQIITDLFFYLFVFTGLIWRLSRSKKVTADTIFGSISGYLLLAVVWSILFQLIEFLHPGSFNFLDGQEINPALFFYFSHITIASVGYGEITPATPLARSVTALLGMVGQLYLTVLVAIIIGIYLSHSQRVD